MSVYTAVSPGELAGFLASYDVGELRACEGIEAGIENTNYFVDTSRGRFVLTIFEWMPAAELPFYLELMHHVAAAGLPAARPVATRDGRLAGTLLGKPAALVTRLAGTNVARPAPAECRELGSAMGRWHRGIAGFTRHHADARGRDWRATAATRVAGRLDAADRGLLEAALDAVRDWPPAGLPGGVIHADLFRDNVLFEAGRLTGLLDFYYACDGPFVYDLAVAFADWCFIPTGRLDPVAASEFLAGYQEQRLLETREIAAWPSALHAAALRFWLSRLVDSNFPKSGTLTFLKDPAEFRGLLTRLRTEAPAFAGIFERRK